MSKRKLAYFLSAVSVTSVGAVAVAYGLKNNTFESLVNDTGFIFSNYAKNLNIKGETKGNSIQSYDRICCHQYIKIIDRARDYVLRYKDEVGAPGIVIGVSVNGQTVWAEGLGMADVENRVPCHPETVMRIASISKSMTMAIVAKLWEEGKIDLDKPVQEYVPNFPKKKYNGKEVTITPRMLASHMAGIRHYTKKGEKEIGDEIHPHDTLFKEFYLKDKFETVAEALKLFQDDELMSNPGTTYLYTTHGFTLLSAVAEGAAKQPFTKLMTSFFKTLGLKNTYLDENDTIIYHRSRYYRRDKKSRLTNVPFADNSYKWAGGGLVSNVADLLHFCNSMLVSYQCNIKTGNKTGFLKPDTVKALWTQVTSEGYGLGWSVVPFTHKYLGGDRQRFVIGHSGGAVGASSIILIVPSDHVANLPNGVSVAIITNLQDVGLRKLALEVSELFLTENDLLG